MSDTDWLDTPEVPSLPEALAAIDADRATDMADCTCCTDDDNGFTVNGQYFSEPGAYAAAYQRDVAKRARAERKKLMADTRALVKHRWFPTVGHAEAVYLSWGRHACQTEFHRDLRPVEVDGLVALAQAHYDAQTAEAQKVA